MARKPKATPMPETPELAASGQPSAASEEASGLRRGPKPKAAVSAKHPKIAKKSAAAAKIAEAEALAVEAPAQQTARASERHKSRKEQQGRKADETTSDAVSEAVGGTVADPSAEAMQPADAAQPADIGLAASQADHPKAAAQWDQATDMVRFDWTEIEQTASRQGPNQGMAKLLIAARAEGANSRWPL